MKKLSILFASFAAVHCGVAAELLTNGTFEEGVRLTDDNVPWPLKPWTDVRDRPVAIFALAQDEKVSGENSLSIERLEKEGNARVDFNGRLPVDLEPGAHYVFRCQIKATEGSPGVLLGAKNAVGDPINLDYHPQTQGAKVYGSDRSSIRLDWKEVENPDDFNELVVNFVAPDEPAQFFVLLDFSHTLGKAWFDDLSLVRED